MVSSSAGIPAAPVPPELTSEEPVSQHDNLRVEELPNHNPGSAKAQPAELEVCDSNCKDHKEDLQSEVASSEETVVAAEESTDEASVSSPPADALSTLRHSVNDGFQSTDSILRAATEAAKTLTRADGVALAFRTKGVIVCRARSGELAPELGSSLNANSGISGECLRTASILVCKEATTDTRVDPDVCMKMGIVSIVAVPLRGAAGIAGILEVFSARSNAFGEPEINWLRGVAEIAEAVYDRERRAQQEATRAALRSAHRLPGLLARATSDDAVDGADGLQVDSTLASTDNIDPRPERMVWVIGVAATALLLITGVWLSWHGPISELADLETAAAAPKFAGPASADPTAMTTAEKRAAGIVLAGAEKTSAANVVKRAAKIEAAASRPTTPASGRKLGATNDSEHAVSAGTDEVAPYTPPANSSDPPPLVTIAATETPSQLARIASSPTPRPEIETRVSQGVILGELIRKVNPVYPVQARAEHITGTVALDVRVGVDGSIRDIKKISGDPLLVAAGMEAVRKWQYGATLLDGHPIETTRRVTLLFKLP